MLVGLAIKLSPGTIIQRMVQFNQSYFFNLLLPPIILNSGYELKRVNRVMDIKRQVILIRGCVMDSDTSFTTLVQS